VAKYAYETFRIHDLVVSQQQQQQQHLQVSIQLICQYAVPVRAAVSAGAASTALSSMHLRGCDMPSRSGVPVLRHCNGRTLLTWFVTPALLHCCCCSCCCSLVCTTWHCTMPRLMRLMQWRAVRWTTLL
jgi:hypothetical protein